MNDAVRKRDLFMASVLGERSWQALLASASSARSAARRIGRVHEHAPAFLGAAGEKVLVKRANPLICLLAQIARACGRVSIGGDPDKRPVNRR
ncbi:hypothetical protein [uncultured Methylovirgula sp.]|uniref:hypothetical protein n=1 Tax=uncultured Methylovirgula sp. TaxID=1285960 RepID=UPI002602224D|nr:hypothetical protein [uncultured Methylovirgula sp.]